MCRCAAAATSRASSVSLRAHGPLIEAWQRRLTEAVARREALQLAEARARREVDIAAAKARNLYNHMEHRIALLFPDDATLVESFFRAQRAPVPADATPVADPVTPDGGAPVPPQPPANENAAPAANTRARKPRRRRVA